MKLVAILVALAVLAVLGTAALITPDYFAKIDAEMKPPPQPNGTPEDSTKSSPGPPAANGGRAPAGTAKKNGGEPKPAEPARPIDNCARLAIIGGQGDCDTYEEITKILDTAPLAYNRPDTMVRGDTIEISLVIDPTEQGKPSARLKGLIGKIVDEKIKVSRTMSAELHGINFRVEPKGPQKRLVTKVAPVRWDWAVTPLVAGRDMALTLDVNIHFQEQGKVSLPVTVRAYRDRIFVDVAAWDRIKDIMAEITLVHTFLAAVLGSGGLLGAIAWYRSRRK
ncbi:MAG: hypothetical protein O2967_15705 [Proteobacteria bacterium]|nr:hypothetical protein [Pseudomonadota bacterium]